MKLAHLTDAQLREALSYVNFTRAVLAINAGSAATFKTTNAVVYTSNGVFKSLSALSAQAFTAGHSVVVAGKTCFFVLSVNGSGTVKTFQGAQFALESDGNYVSGSARQPYNSSFIPDVDDGYTPFGIAKVATTSNFTPGTTALDAAGITTTYYDVSHLPVEPVNL